MMQGEYDNIQKWPFAAIISLTMLDQSNGEDPHHISGTFVTYKNQRAFQKPDTAVQQDILYGYAEFAPIDMICNPRYSRDDTVMIKIEIHPSSVRWTLSSLGDIEDQKCFLSIENKGKPEKKNEFLIFLITLQIVPKDPGRLNGLKLRTKNVLVLGIFFGSFHEFGLKPLLQIKQWYLPVL